MKNQLFAIAAAALVVAGCSKTEVVKVAENRAIGFSSFVGNPTKADLDKNNLKKFFVFGEYDNGKSVAFSNTEVTGTPDAVFNPKNPAYWQAGKTYAFGAYADGTDAAKFENAEFLNGKLTLNSYTVGENDLVAVVVDNVAAPAEGVEKSVALTFKHQLAKVRFTFSTDAVPEAFIMEVSDLKFNAVKTANVDITSTATTWATSGTNADYNVPTLSDYAVEGGSASTEYLYVLPQGNSAIEATFTVTIKDQKTETVIATSPFTTTLETAGNQWNPAFVYNYKATINPDKVDGKLKPITFTVNVDPFENETSVGIDDGDITPGA